MGRRVFRVVYVIDAICLKIDFDINRQFFKSFATMAYMANIALVLSLRMENIFEMLNTSNDMDELQGKLSHMRKQLLDAQHIMMIFKDNTINIERLKELIMYVSLAIRKISVNDVSGLDWCLFNAAKTIAY